MAISQNRYVDITSSVAGGAAVQERELIARLFTQNDRVPKNSILEFATADLVKNYFGETSGEYDRALFYFSRVSKNFTTPKKISFSRWVENLSAPKIYGGTPISTLAQLQEISDGSLRIILDGANIDFASIDLSGAASLADVADVLQTAIRTNADPQLATATVVYDAIRGAFDFAGAVAEAATISADTSGVGTDLTILVGWRGVANVIYSDGAEAETPLAAVTRSAETSNNFASFLFLSDLTLDQITAVSDWNNSKNNEFLYSVQLPAVADAQSYFNALNAFSGTALTLSPTADEFPELAPGMIAATTDYNRSNSVQNYMFQIFDGLTATVTTNELANTLDALRINYIGQTQSAGQNLSFFQRGFLMGGATAAKNMNTYVNEIWLKSAIVTIVLETFLNLNRISANEQGRAQVRAVLQTVINNAINNGSISVQGVINTTQRAVIEQITGDAEAWRTVQNQGYFLSVTITSQVVNDVTEFKINYTLIYKKDDVIRKIEGQDILI